MKKIVALLLIYLLIGFSAHVTAQELDNYSPPPMFGAPKAVPQKQKKRAPIDKLPSVSKEITSNKLKEGSAVLKPQTPPIKKRVITQPKEVEILPPLPKKKPIEALASPEEIKKEFAEIKEITLNPKLDAGIEPIDIIKQETQTEKLSIINVEPPPAPKVLKQGVVKGPKSMPAVGKKDVQIEPTYQEQKKTKSKAGNMFERLKQERQGKIQEKEDPKTALVDMTIKTEDQKNTAINKLANVLAENYILVFDKTESGLSDKHKSQILNNIVPILDSDIDLTLNINAYASPLDGVSFSDRRIALNRALAIRDFLLEQRIEASRINMRSHGFDPSKSPADQIEMGFAQLGM